MKSKNLKSRSKDSSDIESVNTARTSNEATEPLAPEDDITPVVPLESGSELADSSYSAVSTADLLPVEYEDHTPAVIAERAKKQPRESKEIAPYDSFQAYLREIRKYPRLTREEEQELAIKYFSEKEVEAAYKLVSSNLWLVVRIARDYEKAARSILDLIQEGNIGLMEAVKNFDPYRNVRFPSYAVWWIRAYIVRYIIANWRLVKIGTTQAQRKLFFNLKKEKERLEREGFSPEPKLLADRLNVKESEVVEMEQRLAGSDVSVDTPVDAESDATLLTILPNSDSTAEELLASKETRQLLARSLEEFEDSLNEKERLILRERMLNEDKVTLHEIAEQLALSKERVRQIENRIKDKLKAFLEGKFGESLADVEL